MDRWLSNHRKEKSGHRPGTRDGVLLFSTPLGMFYIRGSVAASYFDGDELLDESVFGEALG